MPKAIKSSINEKLERAKAELDQSRIQWEDALKRRDQANEDVTRTQAKMTECDQVYTELRLRKQLGVE